MPKPTDQAPTVMTTEEVTKDLESDYAGFGDGPLAGATLLVPVWDGPPDVIEFDTDEHGRVRYGLGEKHHDETAWTYWLVLDD